MSAVKGQRLSQLLGSVKATKGFTLSKITIGMIEKLVRENSPIYHYQVLNLYHYFSINRDQNAFRKLDPVFFPPRGHEIVELSLRLAYRRLYCLLKYNSPYRLWLPKFKQLLHEAKLNSVDLKFILNLGTLEFINNEDQFNQIYDDFISLYMEEFGKVDSLTLIAIRKIFFKSKMKSKYLPELKNQINKEIQDQLEYFTPSQLKFMFQAKKFNSHELFLYLFKFHSIDKKYAFLFHLYAFPSDWNNWAKSKFTKKQLIELVPSRVFEMRPINFIEGMVSHCTFQRPYVDVFFQFITIDTENGQQTRLKNPHTNYIPFLINAFYYLFPGVENPDLQDFKKIRQVISQTKYLIAHPQYVYIYMAVKHSLVFHSENSIKEKTRQQIQIVKQVACMIKNFGTKADAYVFKSPLFLPTNSLRNVANMNFEVYLLPEFQIILDKIKSLYNVIKQSPMSAWVTSEFDQMKEVVAQYTLGKRPENIDLLYEQFKKVKTEQDSKYDIWIAKNTEVNGKVQVHYLIKLKDKVTNKEFKYLLDFTNSTSYEKKKKISMGKHWKHHYLAEWCQLKYEMATLALLQDYFRSPAFKEHIKAFD